MQPKRGPAIAAKLEAAHGQPLTMKSPRLRWMRRRTFAVATSDLLICARGSLRPTARLTSLPELILWLRSSMPRLWRPRWQNYGKPR
jgi:hypothetical protein